MANEIYHRSNWGNAVNDIYWADVYEKYSATNKMYIRSDYYENSNVTDKLMADIYPKPSILLTPTAYDNGSLHSVKPVKTFGSELVTNGDFATDSNWTKGTGWSIADGTANGNSASGNLEQTGYSFVINKTYKVTYEVKNFVTGSVKFQFTGGGSFISGVGRNSNGIYTEYVKAIANHTNFRFNPTSFTGSIDSVSVKEVIDADFDFTRGSSATRVNEQGLVSDVQILSGELVQNGDFEQIGSEQIINGGFDNDSEWTKGLGWSIADGKATVTNSTTESIYQNILDTSKIYKTTFEITDITSGSLRIGIGINFSDYFTETGTYTYYGKPTTDGLLRINPSSGTNASIDNVSVKEVGQNWSFGTGWSISDGVASQSGGNATLQQSGILTANKIYKLVFEITEITNGSVRCYFGGNYSTYRSSVGTYTEYVTSGGTTTFFVQGNTLFAGSIDNISVIEITDDTDLPRISYTNFDYENGEVVPYSGEGSLLFENQSTNLITYSEDFSQWVDAGTTTVLSNITNPSGGLQSYLLSAASSSTNALRYDLSFSASTNYSYSLFFKAGTSQEVRMQIYDGSSFFRLAINPLNNFEIVDQSGVNSYLIEDFTNGWKKVSINITTSSSASSGYLQIYPDRTGNLNNVYVYGAQLEQQLYPTSYIPTNGSTVTRLADVCNNAGSSDLINSEEGVLYAEISALADDQSYRYITLSDGTNSNYVVIRYYNIANKISAFIENTSGVQGSTSHSFNPSETITDFHKVAFKWKANDFALWIDGVEVSTQSSGTSFSANVLNKLQFNEGDGSGNDFYGNVKCVAVFKEALDNDQLERLTGEGYETFKLLAQANNYTII